jgi:class 3 adenylate cyclase/esterase/lipase
MDAVGSQRSAILGYSEGGPMCALFAATYPERVIALVMIGGYATRVKSPDHPWGVNESRLRAVVNWLQTGWGEPFDLEFRAASMAQDMRFRQWWARYLRQSASPGAAAALLQANSNVDIRHVLPTIRVPTLVLHADKDRTIEVECGRYLASHIPGAKLVEFDSEDHLPFCKGADAIVRHVQEFLTGVRPTEGGDRVLGTIMVEDIVGSTCLATQRGDRQWTDLLAAHNSAVRAELAAFRGREISTTGDGFVATFDGPARAIRCGAAVAKAAQLLGLSVRVGLHTGECEVRGDSIEGLALHIATRVSAAAPPDAVLVSRTVKDLVAGSGIAFDDFGMHALKGVPEQWQLFKARC